MISTLSHSPTSTPLFFPINSYSQTHLLFKTNFKSLYLRNHLHENSNKLYFLSGKNHFHCFSKKRGLVTRLRATKRESPYELLDVSEEATPAEIKKAYRRLALKFHPDVNKEANAQEKFMRIKHAYNMLLNAGSRQRSSYTYSTDRPQSRSSQQEEEFYGFGNFLKDVQVTLADLFRDLQEEFQTAPQEKPKSLWEELAEIGEDFVEFLEKELNIAESNFENQNSSNEPIKGNPYDNRRSQDKRPDIQGEVDTRIEDSIDEVEATLAKLKRELGL